MKNKIRLESYEFTANPGYWRGWPNENYPTKVTRVVTREASTRRLGIESGEADFVDWMSVDDAVARADRRISLRAVWSRSATVPGRKRRARGLADPDADLDTLALFLAAAPFDTDLAAVSLVRLIDDVIVRSRML